LTKAVHAFLQKASNWKEEIPGLKDVTKRHPEYLIKLYKMKVMNDDNKLNNTFT